VFHRQNGLDLLKHFILRAEVVKEIYVFFETDGRVLDVGQPSRVGSSE